MSLDHADYAKRRLREDNAKLKEALTLAIQHLRILLATLEYDDRPSYDQTQAARKAIHQAAEVL